MYVAKLVPLGKYCLSRPLVFSLVPLCHGLLGSQKYTAMFVAMVNRLCAASSWPLSHVRLLQLLGKHAHLGYQGLNNTFSALVLHFAKHGESGVSLDHRSNAAITRARGKLWILEHLPKY